MSRNTTVALVAVDIDDLVTTERTGVVLRALVIGSLRNPPQKLTTAAVARLVGIHWINASLLLSKLERVVPEMRRDPDGWWLDIGHWL